MPPQYLSSSKNYQSLQEEKKCDEDEHFLNSLGLHYFDSTINDDEKSSSQVEQSYRSLIKPPLQRSFSEPNIYIEKKRLEKFMNEKQFLVVKDLSADYLSLASDKNCIEDSSSKERITVVVVPSIDLDSDELCRHPTGVRMFEERLLYNLLLLEDPRVRVVYVTSSPLSPRLAGYYLSLRRGHAYNGITQKKKGLLNKQSPDLFSRLSRLHLLTAHDESFTPLSKKILGRPLLISRIREIMALATEKDDNGGYVPQTAGLSVFTGSASAEQLAKNLGLRMLESSSMHMHWGTKHGCRELFKSCGLPLPPGTPDLLLGDDDLLTTGDTSKPIDDWTEHRRYIRSPRTLAIGLARQIMIAGVRPRKWMVKLNQSFGGKGNAHLDLQKLQCKAYDYAGGDLYSQIEAMANDIEQEFPFMSFEDVTVTWYETANQLGYKNQMSRLGVIAEAFLETQGQTSTSPSVQGLVEPNGIAGNKVKILSTHEQLLNGQVYIGCKNPAYHEYRTEMLLMGHKIGEELASYGVVGHFSVDFLALKNTSIRSSGCAAWSLYAIEINLRQSGTTHPYSIMAALTGGSIGCDGIFRACNGESRYYISKNITNPKLMGLNESALLDVLQSSANENAKKVNWNPEKMTGSVFFALRFLKSHGKVGFLSIEKSEEEADSLYENTVEFLLSIAG